MDDVNDSFSLESLLVSGRNEAKPEYNLQYRIQACVFLEGCTVHTLYSESILSKLEGINNYKHRALSTTSPVHKTLTLSLRNGSYKCILTTVLEHRRTTFYMMSGEK